MFKLYSCLLRVQSLVMVSYTGRALWLQSVYVSDEYQSFHKTEYISTHQPDVQTRYQAWLWLREVFLHIWEPNAKNVRESHWPWWQKYLCGLLENKNLWPFSKLFCNINNDVYIRPPQLSIQVMLSGKDGKETVQTTEKHTICSSHANPWCWCANWFSYSQFSISRNVTYLATVSQKRRN